jgi:MFS superfamily sulfate permease-like transporter
VTKSDQYLRVAVAGAILTAWLFHLDRSGVKLLGAVPGGLPRFGLTSVIA